MKITTITYELVTNVAPMTLSRLITVVANFGGHVMITNIAKATLAASALITTGQRFVVGTNIAMLNASSIVMGEAYNSEHNQHHNRSEILHNVSDVLQDSYLLSLLLSAPAIVTFYYSAPLLKLLNQTSINAEIAETFFRPFSISVPALLCLSCAQQFATLTKKPILIFYSGAIYSSITLALGFALIFGPLGLPKLGVAGFGYSNAVGAYTAMTFMSLYFQFNRHYQDFNVHRIRRHNVIKNMWKIIKLGTPIAFENFMELATLLMLSVMAGSINNEELAATQIGLQYLLLFFIPTSNAATIVGTLGRRYANTNKNDTRRLGNIALFLGVSLSSLYFLPYSLIPQYLIKPFVEKQEEELTTIMEKTELLLLLNGAIQILFTIKALSAGALRSFSETLPAMFISVLFTLMIGLPTSYLLAINAELGSAGLFAGLMISYFFSSTSTLSRWVQVSRRETRDIESLPDSAWQDGTQNANNPHRLFLNGPDDTPHDKDDLRTIDESTPLVPTKKPTESTSKFEFN